MDTMHLAGGVVAVACAEAAEAPSASTRFDDVVVGRRRCEAGVGVTRRVTPLATRLPEPGVNPLVVLR